MSLSKRSPEITSWWSLKTEEKPLVWEYGMLRSTISCDRHGGHKLLDCLMLEAQPWLSPELKTALEKGESLFYEVNGMRVKDGSEYVELFDRTSDTKARIKKSGLQQLIDELKGSYDNRENPAKSDTSVREKHDCQTTTRKRNRATENTKDRGNKSTRPAKRAKIVQPPNEGSEEEETSAATRFYREEGLGLVTQAALIV